MLRLVRRAIPTTADFRGRRLLVREEGRLYGTPLLLVVVAIVVADIAFAVDSIPAAFAVTRDPVVIWTANAFALLGLGSLLALVDILVRRFRYLDKTIALILAFVGIKILAADVVAIGDLASLAVIGAPPRRRHRASLAADRSTRLTRPRRRRAPAALPTRARTLASSREQTSIEVGRLGHGPGRNAHRSLARGRARGTWARTPTYLLARTRNRTV